MPACFANTADSSTWAVGGKCLVITIVQSLHAKNRKTHSRLFVFLFVLNNRFVQSDGFGKNCLLKTCCTFPAQSTIASIFFTSPYNSIPFVRSSSCLFAFVRHTARNWLSPKTPLFLLVKTRKDKTGHEQFQTGVFFDPVLDHLPCLHDSTHACVTTCSTACWSRPSDRMRLAGDQACAAVVCWAWQLDFLWDWLPSTNTCALASPLGFPHALACTYRSNTAMLKAILETTTDFPTFGMAHIWEGVARVAHRHRKRELDCPKCTGCSPTLCDRMPKVSVTLGTEEVTLVLTTLCALGFYHPACTTTQSSHSASLRCVRVPLLFHLTRPLPRSSHLLFGLSKAVLVPLSCARLFFVAGCTPDSSKQIRLCCAQTCNSPLTRSAAQAPKGRQPRGARNGATLPWARFWGPSIVFLTSLPMVSLI